MHAYIYKKQIVQNKLFKRENESEEGGRGYGGQSATDVLWILMILRCTVIVVVDWIFAANS